MVTTVSGFPFKVKPITNVTPFTERDGSTYLEMLERMRSWLNSELVPNINESIRESVQQFIDGFGNAERHLIEELAKWPELFDAFKTDLLNSETDFKDETTARFEAFLVLLNEKVASINNRVGPEQMQRYRLVGNITVTPSHAWPDAHPILFQVMQDAVGGRKIAFSEDVDAAEFALDPTPNAVTRFWLVPQGEGRWAVSQPAETTNVPGLANADLSREGSALRDSVRTIARESGTELFPGRLKVWGDALKNRVAAPAIWVALGSSTTDGFGVAKAYGYVGRIAAHLTRRPSNAGMLSLLAGTTSRPANGVHVYEGVAIDSAIYLSAEKLDAIRILQPQIITHMIGSNDYMSQNSVAFYIANIKSAYDRIKAVSPNTVHLYIHQQQRNDLVNPPIPWSAYGEGLRVFAAERKELFLNLADDVFGGEKSIYPNMLSADNVHMNVNGYAYIAHTISQAMGVPLPEGVTEFASIPFNAAAKTPIPTNVGTVVAEGTIKAAPYARKIEMTATMLAYGTAAPGTVGPECGLVMEYADDKTRLGTQQRIRFLNGGLGYAATHSGTSRFDVEPNRAVNVMVVFHHPAGETVIDWTAPYSKVEGTLIPA